MLEMSFALSLILPVPLDEVTDSISLDGYNLLWSSRRDQAVRIGWFAGCRRNWHRRILPMDRPSSTFFRQWSFRQPPTKSDVSVRTKLGSRCRREVETREEKRTWTRKRWRSISGGFVIGSTNTSCKPTIMSWTFHYMSASQAPRLKPSVNCIQTWRKKLFSCSQ